MALSIVPNIQFKCATAYWKKPGFLSPKCENLDRQPQLYHLKIILSLIFSPQAHRISMRR
jgi:hypothetical protein